MENLIFKKGETIFKKGDQAQEVYIVKKGRVDIMSDGSDKAVKLTTVKSGKFFGEMGIIDQTERSANAVASSNVSLISIDGASFEAFAKQNPSDAIKLIKQMTKRLDKTTDKYYTVCDRVLDFINSEEDLPKRAELREKLEGIVKNKADAKDYKVDKKTFKPDETLATLKEISDSLRTVTAQYVDILKDISEIIGDVDYVTRGGIWAEMGKYASEYNGMMGYGYYGINYFMF